MTKLALHPGAFSDGTDYAPSNLLSGGEWPTNPATLSLPDKISVLARAVFILASNARASGELQQTVRLIAEGPRT